MHVHDWFPMFHLWLILLSLLFISSLTLSIPSEQFKSPQNIEVFFPFLYSPPTLIPPNSHLTSFPSHHKTSSTNGILGKAIAATAVSTIVVAVFFLSVERYRRLNAKTKMGLRQNDEIMVSNDDGLKKLGRNITGLVVDEEGLDVIYWRQLQSPHPTTNVPEDSLNENKEELLSERDQKIQNRKHREPIQDGQRSSNSSSGRIRPESQETYSGRISIPGQMKLKTLVTDKKVRPKADHSTEPDKISEGSSCSNDDVAEALFGYVAKNRSPKETKVSSNIRTSNTNPPAQIFILDPNKSQNTALLLRSIYITRKEILDALIEGRMSLHLDTLEKLTRIAPTVEEQQRILEFNGNPTKLADAESFIYHLLKSVPSPFSRLNAILFRANYDAKILHLRNSLQTFELGCNELRINGVFFKLLRAVAVAQGTNLKEFNLIEFRNLCKVKTDDGNTNLMQLTVEEVIKTEGKCCMIKQNQNFEQSGNAHNSKSSSSTKSNTSAEERDDHEYMMLGLPIVEGICKELSNVKKAAIVDYNEFVKTCFDLDDGFAEIRDLFLENVGKEDDGFMEKMKSFLYRALDEFKGVRADKKRIMEMVKRTREIYFQGGLPLNDNNQKDQNHVQLFVVVKEFISMVDHACIDIGRNLKKMEREGLRFQRISSIL